MDKNCLFLDETLGPYRNCTLSGLGCKCRNFLKCRILKDQDKEELAEEEKDLEGDLWNI